MNAKHHHLRHIEAHQRSASVFGDDWFGRGCESFARFFGTPQFLIIQTVITVLWMILSYLGITHYDPYPFILLNFVYTVQSGYAAPMILLAQTRQADRDKAAAEADAHHREELAAKTHEASALLLDLVQRNIELTSKVEQLTQAVHAQIIPNT